VRERLIIRSRHLSNIRPPNSPASLESPKEGRSCQPRVYTACCRKPKNSFCRVPVKNCDLTVHHGLVIRSWHRAGRESALDPPRFESVSCFGGGVREATFVTRPGPAGCPRMSPTVPRASIQQQVHEELRVSCHVTRRDRTPQFIRGNQVGLEANGSSREMPESR